MELTEKVARVRAFAASLRNFADSLEERAEWALECEMGEALAMAEDWAQAEWQNYL